MKKLISILTLLAFASTAMAANITDDTLKIGKPGSSANKVIKLGTSGQVRYNGSTSKLQFSHDGTNFKNVGSGGGGGSGGVNLLSDNPDAESGTGNWTASGGSFATTSTAANVFNGSFSFSFTPSAANQTLNSDAYATLGGMEGNNGCSAAFWYKTAEGTNKYIANVLTGSTNLGTLTLEAASVYTLVSVPYPCQTTGTTVFLQIKAASSTPSSPIYFDDAFLGMGFGTSQVSQASFIGGGYFATTASCAWTRTSTSIGAFGTTAACPGPTIESNPGPGTIQTTDADLPRVTVANLPAGEYDVVFTHALTVPTAVAVTTISDGTTTSGRGISNDGSAEGMATVLGHFSYTSSGTRTFEVYGASSSGTMTINNNTNLRQMTFRIYRWPSGQDTAVRADSASVYWAGYHDNTCSWARTNTAQGDPTADASCNLVSVSGASRGFGSVTASGNTLPAITFTPPRAGSYEVCAWTTVLMGSANAQAGVSLTDGTTTFKTWAQQINSATTGNPIGGCAIVPIASTSPITLKLQSQASTGSVTMSAGTYGNAVDWTVKAIDGGSANMQMFKGLVTTGGTGQYRMEYLRVNPACTTGTCTQINTSSSWASSVTWASTGNYTVNFAAGTFSAAPLCWCNNENGNNRACTLGLASTSSVNLVTWLAAATIENDPFGLFCIGPR